MSCFKNILRRRRDVDVVRECSSSALVPETEVLREPEMTESADDHFSGLEPSSPPQRPVTNESSEMTSQRSISVSASHHSLDSSTLLRKELLAARIEYPRDSCRFFIPRSEKERIITKCAISRELLARYDDLDTQGADELAGRAFQEAKDIFAILAYLKKGGEVRTFLDEGITDEDLPFERCEGGACSFSMRRRKGDIVQALERWESDERESFTREQWFMLAPIFEDQEHKKFPRNTVLPFVSLHPEEMSQEKKSVGGYSEVSTARIHSAHHMFSDHWAPDEQDPKVAIKKLHTKSPKDFENERNILEKLGSKRHSQPHLVKLLTSFEIDGEFYLVFPRANCNLRKYWKDRPEPPFDQDTVLWSLRQMRGISQALNTIHNFRITHPYNVRRIPQQGIKLSVKPGEEIFGRHGDIKPENIIWFERTPDYDGDGMGVLQITDFGLGRFHGRDSKTEPPPHHIVGSPTYEPPECQLQRPVSRKYDLWSLGCLYLEFVTWLLKGSKEIEGFSEWRAQPLSGTPLFTDDYFFETMRGSSGEKQGAQVREGVINWVRDLHADSKCSNFIHDVLDLVMDDLLQVDAKNRIETSHLCYRFNEFLQKACADDQYLLAPRPRPARAKSTMAVQISKKSQKKVVFDEPNIRSLREFHQSLPKDLVQRTLGTPGHPTTKSRTWPMQGGHFGASFPVTN